MRLSGILIEHSLWAYQPLNITPVFYQSGHVASTTAKLARTRAARMVGVIGFEPIHVVSTMWGRRRARYLPGTRGWYTWLECSQYTSEI